MPGMLAFITAIPFSSNGTHRALLTDHSEILAYHHLVLVIAILTLALVALGGGKGLGVMLKPLISKILGKPSKEVTVNVGASPPTSPPDGPKCVLVDPTRCPDHKAEHERSIRNEKGIYTIQTDLKATRGQLFEKMESNKQELSAKLDNMETMLSEVRVAVAKLVVESDFQLKKRR